MLVVPPVSEQQFGLGAKLDLWFAPAQHNDVLGDLGEVLPQPRESRGHLAELTPNNINQSLIILISNFHAND